MADLISHFQVNATVSANARDVQVDVGVSQQCQQISEIQSTLTKKWKLPPLET